MRATPTVMRSPTRSSTACRSEAAMSTGGARHLAQPADVEEGLVDGERLDERRGVVEHREHRPAGGGVGVHPGRHDDRVGAQRPRLTAAHGAPHAAGPGLVARGHDDPAADDHRLAPQRGVVALLDRREERVEVGVEDGGVSTCGRVGHEHMFASRPAAQAGRARPGSPSRSESRASRSQVESVTPRLRSSCLRTRIDASVRGRSSTTST